MSSSFGRAILAERKHLKAVKKANGATSYLTYSITSDDGRGLGDEIDRARMSLNGW